MFCISHEWKFPKLLLSLCATEFFGTVAALTLFGIADPDTYHSALWKIGAENGYNSSPNLILFAYANYKPIPTTPLVWSSFPTSFNVVISVFSMFILLVKGVMFVLHMWYPILSLIVNTIITALWAFSIYGQAGPDYSDPEHPMPVAWYIVKSCSVAAPSGNYQNCLMAKGAFAVSCIMLAIFFANLVLSVYSVIPSKEQREERKLEKEDRASHMPRGLEDSPSSELSENKPWEMESIPSTSMRQPYTPRSLAFNTLDRQLPLRAQYK